MYTYIENTMVEVLIPIDETTQVHEFQFAGLDENDFTTNFFLVIYNEIGVVITFERFKDQMILDYTGMPGFGFSDEDYEKMWGEIHP